MGGPPVIYELRTYYAMPGKMPALNKRFAEVTMALFAKHGIKVVGFWQNDIGGASDELIYMLGFESLAQREQAWRSFGADPEWQAKRAESEKDGPLLSRITNQILRLTPYSPETPAV
jgi:hypothetical protein